jgi:Zinc finger, C2H2 type/C2H2-type zinc finger
VEIPSHSNDPLPFFSSEDDGSQDAEPMEEEMIDEFSEAPVENEDSADDTSEIVPEWVLLKRQRMLRATKPPSTANNKDPKTCCCSCEQTFANEEEVIAHARSDHKVMATDVTDESDVEPTVSDKKNAKCKVCLKEFRSLIALRAHRLRFTAMKQCPECDALVAKKRFSVHLRTHDSNPVECDICGLKLKSERMLGPHKKSHEINGHFKCDECPKEFINEIAFQRHVNHHRYRKKPFRFSCEQCNKGFRSPGQLRNHMRIHTGLSDKFGHSRHDSTLFYF